MRRKFVLVLSMLVAVSLPAMLVFAATDTTETAGAQLERFQEEQEFRNRVLKRQIAEKGGGQIEELPPSVEAFKEGKTFTLKDVTLTGNDSIPSEAFSAFIQKYIGREVYLADLQELAADIKRYYREQGYIAAYVYIPPQTITDGVVEIVVIEGKLGLIEVKGNKWFSSKVIRRFLRLSSGQVLLYDELRDALAFLNKARDLQAKAVLKPGEATGTTDLEIDVKDKFPVHIGSDVNNLGTKNTGLTRVGFSLSDTNLFGQMDQLSSRFQLGKHSWAIGADYNIPVHSSGTRLGVSYTRSWVQLVGQYGYLGIDGNATDYAFYALQPLIRKSWIETTFNTGFDWKTIKNLQLGQKSGTDELRILNTGLSFEFTDRWGKTIFPHSFHFGFSSFLGASPKDNPNGTRPGAGGQFFIYRTSLMRYQRLPMGMMYSFRGQMQLTDQTLPPSEQLSLGGAFAVRGYPQAEYLADYGAYMTNEVFVPTYFFPKDWQLPYSKQPLRQQVQAVGFCDLGGGVIREVNPGERDSRTLAGIGGGVRIHMFDKVYSRIQWAAPLASDPTDGSHSAFYFTVSAEFF